MNIEDVSNLIYFYCDILSKLILNITSKRFKNIFCKKSLDNETAIIFFGKKICNSKIFIWKNNFNYFKPINIYINTNNFNDKIVIYCINKIYNIYKHNYLSDSKKVTVLNNFEYLNTNNNINKILIDDVTGIFHENNIYTHLTNKMLPLFDIVTDIYKIAIINCFTKYFDLRIKNLINYALYIGLRDKNHEENIFILLIIPDNNQNVKFTKNMKRLLYNSRYYNFNIFILSQNIKNLTIFEIAKIDYLFIKPTIYDKNCSFFINMLESFCMTSISFFYEKTNSIFDNKKCNELIDFAMILNYEIWDYESIRKTLNIFYLTNSYLILDQSTPIRYVYNLKLPE